MLSYINSLGRNIRYYPDKIKLLHGFDLEQTKKFLSEDVMKILEDEVTRIMTEKERIRQNPTSSTLGQYGLEGPAFDAMSSANWDIKDAGKIRSAKRHPRRKSSTVKRRLRRRRTSRK